MTLLGFNCVTSRIENATAAAEMSATFLDPAARWRSQRPISTGARFASRYDHTPSISCLLVGT